jgi:hypothetical protein
MGLIAGVTLGVAGPLPAAEPDPPPALLEAASCMARVLDSIPEATRIGLRLSEGSGTPYPIVEYSVADEQGRRRFAEIRLFEIPGALTRFVFDRADIAGDPVALRALPLWTRRCEVSAGYITSYPGAN